jgi:hypothetical protein
MANSRNRRALPFLALLAMGPILSACGWSGREEGFEGFTPSPELARTALAASLQAWKDGRPPGAVTTMTPTVETVDTDRTPDRPLKAFEILGPVGGDDLRCFAVRLTFDDAPEEQVVRYVVLGKDPLWVYRQEDLERMTHWEHKMETAEAEEVLSGEDEKIDLNRGKPEVHHPTEAGTR